MKNFSNEEIVVSTLKDENDGDLSAGDLSLRGAIANIGNSNRSTGFDSESDLVPTADNSIDPLRLFYLSCKLYSKILLIKLQQTI